MSALETAGDDGKGRPDLSSLSEAERTTLDLLARGHTAKSIARLTGQTENAVNERLRSARRKSGVGSSRELARLLGRQKTWDPENRAEARTSLPTEEQRPARRRTGLATLGALIMSLALALTATLLLQAGPPPSAPAEALIDDPLIGSMIPPRDPSTELREMHAKVRTEPRDAGWAGPTEAALRAAYAKSPEIGADAQAYRVICGSTLCEVAGTLEPKRDAEMQALQGVELWNAAKPLGLASVSSVFGSSPTNPKQSIFATYWKRTPG